MAEFNHTIIWCSDKHRSSEFLASILGTAAPRTFPHFQIVDLANHVSLDYYQTDGPVAPQHYAFLVSDEEFEAGFARVGELDLTYWADPARSRPGEINRHFGGRGVYFEDPDKHLLELITKPYGSESEF